MLITGASDGIGLASAIALHRRGWHVVVHARNEAKARASVRKLDASGSNATPVWGDLSQQTEVVALADQITSQFPALDVLLNNAGIYPTTREITVDGFELTMAVNYFSHYLLTLRLLPTLKNAPDPRIINVSSMTHSGASLVIDDLCFEKSWDAYAVYASSKLANLLFTHQLAKSTKKTRICANACHPGVIGTKLLRAGFSMGGATVEAGASTSVFLASDAAAGGISGKYFIDSRQARASAQATNDRLALALWNKSAELLAPYL